MGDYYNSKKDRFNKIGTHRMATNLELFRKNFPFKDKWDADRTVKEKPLKKG